MKSRLLYFVLLTGLCGCTSTNSNKQNPTSVNNTSPLGNKTLQHTGIGALFIQQIGFKEDAYIRDAVKKECNLVGKLTQFIEENATGQFAQIITDSTSYHLMLRF